ncbi:hypothetical protein GGI23_003235 [Coemansia sp. RSA 2559]|nr:hypothetical protein GGI23_003235 [Coemansia sp. RSA 2559]KAJ2867217.1 hypothetical protein GGI22_001111 [Coemansia erecta]
MKFLAVSAALVAAVATANAQGNSIPSQTLNSFQAGALATLSAAQAAINSMNSQHIAENKASQEAALLSQSLVEHGNTEDLGHLLSEMESSELGSLDVDEASEKSSASSVAGSMLAIALMAGAAMF